MKTVAEKQSSVRFRDTAVPVLSGVLGAFILSVVLLLAFSLLVTMKDMPGGANLAFATVSIGGGVFFGGFVTARLSGRKGMMYGALQGITYFVVLYLFGLMMRQVDLHAYVILKIAVAVVFGALGGIAGVNSRKKKFRI